MPLNDREAAYLWDLLATAKEVHAMMQRQDLEDLLQDRLLQLALERCLEVLGEIARRMSDDTLQAIPGVEWKKIIGMRNVLAHEYGHIDHERLYQAAKYDVPALIASLVLFQSELENAADNAAFESRAAEPELSLEELVKVLEEDIKKGRS